ncbi:MAG: (d)CMP kinase [Phycisphaerales bacterium]|nr:(d)CMP kinase [Phycisphaerales bacterium]
MNAGEPRGHTLSDPSAHAGEPASGANSLTEPKDSGQASARHASVIPQDVDIIVTIDGPAGTGKSTVAQALAERLGLDLLDTGAMYRAAAAIAIDRGLMDDIEAEDPATRDPAIARFVEVVTEADVHFDWTTDPPAIMAWSKALGRFEPINERIRTPDVTRAVSIIAGIVPLRHHMVRKQRIIAHQHPRLVTEGRDQGSVVFPDALVKFFLDADLKVRAERRADQLRAAGYPAEGDELMEQLAKRDEADRNRDEGPLICPDDAITVDTSDLTFEQVVDRLGRDVLDRVGVA